MHFKQTFLLLGDRLVRKPFKSSKLFQVQQHKANLRFSVGYSTKRDKLKLVEDKAADSFVMVSEFFSLVCCVPSQVEVLKMNDWINSPML